MRLSKEKVDVLGKKVYDVIKSSPTFEILADELSIVAEVKTQILKDLKREDEIDKEVEKILEPYKKKISERSMNFHILMKKAKKELAKKKGIVL